MPSMSPEYFREYRARRKELGRPVRSGKSGKSGRKETLFDRGQFIAWDGEGWNTGQRIDEFTERHAFTLWASSEDTLLTVQPGQDHIPTIDLFASLIQSAKRHPKAINVVYGGSYDMNQILRDIPRDKAKRIASEETKIADWRGYRIEFVPRKYLRIKHGDTSITLWDVIGFFQMSFVKALEQWLGKDYPELPLIRDGKSKRASFADYEMDYLIEYNNAECRALVNLMDQFKAALSALGLTLRRWDGAGAVAAAILTKHAYKSHVCTAPPPVELAARHAYAGGRFEVGLFGHQAGQLYGYDINSAYPSVYADMPSLASGEWRYTPTPALSELTDFSLIRVRWNIPGIRFGPFCYRLPNGQMLFPREGENWVWYPEIAAWEAVADQYPDATVDYVEAWSLDYDPSIKPFTWVRDYYSERQRIVNGDSELPYGCQMVLKLGLNSLYGKTVQSVGYNPKTGRIPPFHSILYGGYITSATRAKLWHAAMSDPENIIMLATDGLLARQRIGDLQISATKQLGAWEQSEYSYVMAVQSGIYITGDGSGLKMKRRGIEDERNVEAFRDEILAAWGDRTRDFPKLAIRQPRLIGIRSAVISDAFWLRWGSWYDKVREMEVSPPIGGKRVIDFQKSRIKQPSKGFVSTNPATNSAYQVYEIMTGQTLMSTAYERPWDRDNWDWQDEEETAEIVDGIVA